MLDDKPAMADFNRDNKIVDEELARVDQKLVNTDAELEKKADKAAPIVHELELTDGFEKMNAANYVKTQEGMVTLTYKVRTKNALSPGTTVSIGVLPVGFRPPVIIHYAAAPLQVNRSTMCAWVSPNGVVYVQCIEGISAGAGGFMGTVTFFTQM